MRNEQEMLKLILDTATSDIRIRAVIMNGSRVNPNATRDIFQDFDIVYIVTDVETFSEDPEWIKRFSELIIMQTPEDMQDPPPCNNASFSYLMLFTDGNRIDLWLHPVAKLKEINRDSLSQLLLDKDGIIEPFPPPSEIDYLPKPPTARAFSDCCNEFWWVSTYVAKGLWRAEITYPRNTFEQTVRPELIKMLTWHIGIKTEFSRNLGYHGKYFERYLDPDLWDMLLKTYSDASYDNTWEALFTACSLFRIVAVSVAEHFGFDYPHGDDKRVSAHLRYVRSLPRNAKEIY
jgi:aminoglycoside 6-adenylyltransferase